MTDEDWLRAGLADAVPEAPGAPDRAAAALARARRDRRRTTIVGAASVAVTLTVVGAIATLGDGRSPDRVAAEPPSPLDVATCPAEPVDALTQVGPDHVPDGAVSVRLCDGGVVLIDVPQDALVTEVDDVAAAVNGLEDAAPRACTEELGPGYQLVFAYADGTSVVAAGRLYGCREVVVNGAERIGADAPLERFIELLREQREGLEPPQVSTADGLECLRRLDTVTAPIPLGRAQDLEVAVLCVTSGGRVDRRAEIAERDMEVLVADMEQNTQSGAGMPSCLADPPPIPRILGLTAWRDLVRLSGLCGSNRFHVEGTEDTVWTPGPEAAAIIERLIG
ncbi:hypothetical protein ASE01_08210 [Nocardioides sp. Root190]|uniref:hypothetical protein n=1 Tax=Nocardioides sp. Root190 TaxID=1736488 RepID=UPI0006F7F360|nr:hypothetical protein [Nocardioides sp. Root190]KRB78129.1 hypothetical protein ASE01_08210 [Nocardioides sp. Root190]